MSHDIITQIKNLLPAVGSQELDEDTKAVAGAGTGGKRISIKGGVFRKYAGGKEVGKVEDRHMNVIFVKMSHTPARTFYSSGYEEGSKISPTCWSSDSKHPDADVKTPAAPSCDKCPNSIKGSGANGKGTACRLSWRTAVVLPQHPDGDVMQLVLPSTSVFGDEEDGKFPFRAYIQYLAGNGISVGRVVTRMQFDTNAPVPKLLFSPVAATPVEMLDVIKEQGQSAAALNAVKLTVYQTDEESKAPAQPAIPAPVAAAQVEEPVKREAPAASTEVADDVADVLKKWTSKKKSS